MKARARFICAVAILSISNVSASAQNVNHPTPQCINVHIACSSAGHAGYESYQICMNEIGYMCPADEPNTGGGDGNPPLPQPPYNNGCTAHSRICEDSPW